jgi:hypothetical protein
MASEEADGGGMDLTQEVDPFVLDYLLDRGWLSGRDLCRVAQTARVFGRRYTESGLHLSRVGHAARRRLTDWLGLRPGPTETHLGLLVLIERSLELCQASDVPRGVVLYLWARERIDDTEHVRAVALDPTCVCALIGVRTGAPWRIGDGCPGAATRATCGDGGGGG